MPPTISAKNSCNYRALLFLATYSAATALLLLSPKSDAYEWELTPSMHTDLIFTDNLRLVPDNSPVKKEAEFITRLNPGFYSRFTSRRFDSEINFRLRNILYASNSSRNRTLINLRTYNTGEIIKNLFYVDANARIRQQNQSILAPQGDDANLTGNLRSVQIYSVSPYIRKRFSDFATTEIRYARILTDSDASNTFFNSNVNAYQFSLISGTNFRTLEWGLNYSREDIDFDFRPKTVKLETEIANIQYNFTRNFGLTGTGGYEENTFGGGPVDKPKGIRWSAGFIWFPTPRTSLEASFGQRFFGDTYAYNVTHRMRFMAFRSSYKERVRSVHRSFLLEGAGDTFTLLTDLLTSQAPPGTSPAEIALAAQELIANLGLQPSQFFDQPFLTNRFFLEKRFMASMAIHGKKNTLLFRIFDINRKPLARTTLFLDSLFVGQRISREQQGINLSWSWRVSPRTFVNVSGLYTRLHFPIIFRRDELRRYSIGVTRRFTKDIVGMLRYRRRERTSNVPLRDHTENRFIASLRMSF